MREANLPFFANNAVSERKRAIVVHDDPTVGFRLADRLAIHGYEAILARRIDDLQQDLVHIRPNVIVCDLHRSGKPDALSHLQAVCPLVPIIAMVQPDGFDARTSWRTRQTNLSGSGVFVCSPTDCDEPVPPLQ
jgi:NAD(P)-dependent dehydrogenase (short-subunit alcohol dehydrogenase family)